MRYLSTRDAELKLSSAQAIAQGLSREGGLFVPEEIPKLPLSFFEALGNYRYDERAAAVLAQFLTDYSAEELKEFTKAAYCAESFGASAAPLHKLNDTTSFLELWHGPTCAFKDMALQIMPRLLTAALRKNGETKKVCILVATSGDTGKAALEGFKDVEGTSIFVFYPSDGVSDVQKLQMQTQLGGNVGVCAVYGNFDDAQTGVKKIFGSEELRETLSENGWFFSSANSINWGRLVPQVAYYCSAYCDMVKSGAVRSGEPINFCVPTGNFGNILAGWIAKQMGLPVKKFICASNANNVLSEFIETGCYNKNRPFHCTMSPSMDILISSNLERLLYLMSGSDKKVRSYMEALNTSGIYQVEPELLSAIQRDFACGWSSEEETAASIASLYKNGYLCDTHTAVAYHVLEAYRAKSGDETPTVVVSTASPYKFCDNVLKAIGMPAEESGTKLIETLSEVTGSAVPKPLFGLDKREKRFNMVVETEAMPAAVLKMLNIC